jgi:hypothetical protein
MLTDHWMKHPQNEQTKTIARDLTHIANNNYMKDPEEDNLQL